MALSAAEHCRLEHNFVVCLRRAAAETRMCGVLPQSGRCERYTRSNATRPGQRWLCDREHLPHAYGMVSSGAINSRFEIYEGNDGGRAGFDWKDGQSYLLFLFPSSEKRGAYWAIDGCGNSNLWDGAQPALKGIEALKQHRGGVIQVAVGLSPEQFTGAKLSVSGSGHESSAMIDQSGRSEIHVAPGRYFVSAAANAPLEPYFMSYENPMSRLKTAVVHKSSL